MAVPTKTAGDNLESICEKRTVGRMRQLEGPELDAHSPVGATAAHGLDTFCALDRHGQELCIVLSCCLAVSYRGHQTTKKRIPV
jgi:hypothetical protein